MPDRTRVIIVDDEPLSRERIRQMLEPHHEFEIVAECVDGVDAMDAIVRDHPDLVFLDITMPGLDGLAVVDALGEDPPLIVFVTAHEQFAHRAFDLNAVDYLVKPVSRERFDQALARLQPRLRTSAPRLLDPGLRAFLEQLQAERGYARRFLVRSQRGHYFVAVADIDWLEAEGNYVVLHAGGERHVLRTTMKSLEARLNPDQFVRVHRSAIVNVDRIERLEPQGHGEYLIVLKTGTRLESSRAYSAGLQELMRGA